MVDKTQPFHISSSVFYALLLFLLDFVSLSICCDEKRNSRSKLMYTMVKWTCGSVYAAVVFFIASSGTRWGCWWPRSRQLASCWDSKPGASLTECQITLSIKPLHPYLGDSAACNRFHCTPYGCTMKSRRSGSFRYLFSQIPVTVLNVEFNILRSRGRYKLRSSVSRHYMFSLLSVKICLGKTATSIFSVEDTFTHLHKNLQPLRIISYIALIEKMFLNASWTKQTCWLPWNTLQLKQIWSYPFYSGRKYSQISYAYITTSD
jgi:hypothetical protein